MERSIQFTVKEEIVDFRDRLQDKVILKVYIDGKYFDTAMVHDTDSAYALIKMYQNFSRIEQDVWDYEVYANYFSIDRELYFRDWENDANRNQYENNFETMLTLV